MEYQKVSDEDIDFMIERANAATSGPWAWNAPDEVCGTYAIYEAGEGERNVHLQRKELHCGSLYGNQRI